MSENDKTCLPLIIYYMREKYYRHAINTAVKSLKLYNNDPVLRFFKAFATLMEEFIQLRDHPYLSLCSTAALIYAHRRSEATDLEAVNQLNWELKLSGSAAGDRALYYAALLYWILELDLKARTCIKKMLKLSETSPEGLILKGWIVLTSDTEENRPQAIRYFDSGVQDAGNLFGLMGKMEFFMAKQNEQCALDIANQIIASHPDFSPALLMKMKVFVSLRDWEQTEAVAQRVLERDRRDLKALQMMTVIAAAKDGNMELCGHNPEILQMLTVFVRRVSSRTPVVSDVICELGYLLNHQSKYKDAHKCYSTALKTEPKCTSALVGTVSSHPGSNNIITEVPLLKALLGRKQSAGEETVMQLLKDATERHFSALRGLNYGVEYLQMLDLNFLLQIVCMHLESKQDFALVPGQTPPFWLKHSNMILETVIKAVPGMSVSCYYMAYIKFLLGEHRTAQHFLNLCIEKGPSVPEVHLLQTIFQYFCVCVCFELMSVIYQVRDRFQFHLLKARALLRSGDLKNAIQCLKITMNMPGVRRPSEGPQFFISPSERVSVYLELTEALRLNGEQHEATRVLQDAILCFKGTPEETRLMLANVDLALARDDVDAAVVVLQNILPTESAYIQAREKMAHIYLERKHNEKLYITCYREISEQLPGAHTRILLADAFMKIHQPEEAVKIYREVEKIAPKDTLAKKIGQALVKAHEYDTAVSYYETALKTDTLDCLVSVELSELLLKLKRFEKAQQVLEKLHDLQQKVVFRTANEHPEELEDQRKSLVVICCDWAREFHLRRNLEKAKQHYTDALNHSPDNEEVNTNIIFYIYINADILTSLTHALLDLRHSCQLTEALMHLNKARGDADWGEPAVDLMVRICLNPDRDVFGGEVLHKGQKDTSSESESETRISTAHNILSMFRPRSKSEQDKLELLSNLCRIYSKEPKEVERAVLELTDMQAKNVMLEASLLMMAQGFVQLKQIPRARNFLKRLSRMEWSDTNADDLESACLLLADMYIKTGKYTQVDKLLDSCIRYNQSCSKAYEYRGLIMESEQRHSDAALQYELAWKHSSRAHPAVGATLSSKPWTYYKYSVPSETLAFESNCRVLQQRPDYPEIQDELLTRAQLSLRL
uniref:Tetratricopeptide repeat protein 21B-like n=1 Tax=Sinocyclocheilus anshuiensis TaxID=1608454 RepID=A0A671NPY4_9TELE